MYRGLDSSSTCIYLNNGEVVLVLDSWHELHEQSPEWIATEYTVEKLEGRDKDMIVAGWSAKYKKFRSDWDFIRNEAEKLIQAEETDEINEEIQFDYIINTITR